MKYNLVAKPNKMYETEQDNIRFNTNCLESEKTGGEHPCSGNNNQEMIIKSIQHDVSDIFPTGVYGGVKTTGKVDPSKPYTIIIKGNTFNYKDSLKSEGFNWNTQEKRWEKHIVPPDKPNPYGGTVEENQIQHLGITIRSAGKGKYAGRNLTAEILQSEQSNNKNETTPKYQKQVLTPIEQEKYEIFKTTPIGKAMGQQTTFAVSGKTLTYDRGAKITLLKLPSGGTRLTLHVNNPYTEGFNNEDVYSVEYSEKELEQAIKDYTYTTENKNDSTKNFDVFEKHGYKWPGIKYKK